jgi:Ca2+-binding RTX toxin-like protein
MWNPSRLILAVCAAASVTVAARSAVAGGTCTFDPVAGVMVVEIIGATTLRPQPARILMDNVPCGDATLTTVDTIQVTGSGNLELNMRSRPFAPGRTPEADGVSEIEVDVQLTSGTVRFSLDSTSNQVVMVGTGVDFFADGDLDDFTIAGVFRVSFSGGLGDDLIDASGAAAEQIDGGPGNDVLRGADILNGDDGDDILIAGPTGASFDDGPGDDIAIGGAGGDRFFGGRAANGADQFIGGGGVDTVDYTRRTTAVQIALDGSSESGELSGGVPIEGDRIAADVENAEGGPEDDVLIGNDQPNRLGGREGNDLVVGDGGDDHLDGSDGDDDLVGGDGDDDLLGLAGNDFLDGGAGNDFLSGLDGDDDMVGGDGDDRMIGTTGDDTFLGGPGNDVMLGGLGNDRLEGGDGFDFYRGNQGSDHLEAPADGFIEEIRCGTGDDTFVAGPEDIIHLGCFP